MLEVIFDHAQRRLASDRIAVTVAGDDWTGGIQENLWREPLTQFVLVRPVQLTPEWDTQTSGQYARWSLEEFGLGAGWHKKDDKAVGQARMTRSAPMDAPEFSSQTLPANQGMWVSYFCHNEGDRDRIVFECGWSNVAGGDGVSLRFFAGGRVDVYDDGRKIGTGSLGTSGGINGANRYVNLVLLPWKLKELLIYSSTDGGGFSQIFDRITEDDAAPIVTKAAKFWFKATISPDVEIAPLRCPSTAWGASPVLEFSRPPLAGDLEETFWENGPIAPGVANARVIGDSFHAASKVASVRFVKEDGETAFVPDGVSKAFRLRMDLASHATLPPVIEALHMAYAARFAVTDSSEEADVANFCTAARWEQPDDPGGNKVVMSFADLDALTEIVAKPTTQKNRPIKIVLDGVTILDGRGIDLKTEGEKHVRTLSLSAIGEIAALRKHRYTSRVPLDGLRLSRPVSAGVSAASLIIGGFGIPNDRIVLSDSPFRLPRVPGRKAGEFTSQIESGDDGYSALDRLRQAHAPDWILTERPRAEGSPETVFLEPFEFSDAPEVVVYCCSEDGVEDGLTENESRARTFGPPADQPIPTEANEVTITGWDPRTGRAVQAYKIDHEAQEPTTPPSERPDNWEGEPVPFAAAGAQFVGEESCVRAAELVYAIVVPSGRIAEWPGWLLCREDGEVQVPLPRGTLVTLGEFGDRRISAFQCDLKNAELVAGMPFYIASYTGGTLYNMGGKRLWEIVEAAHKRGRAIIGRDAPKIVGALVATSTKVPD